MADKQKLRDMLDSLIKDNNEDAQVAFHTYATEKMKEQLQGELEAVEDKEDE